MINFLHWNVYAINANHSIQIIKVVIEPMLIVLIFCPVVGVSTNHICVSTQTNAAFARVFGESTNHGARK